MPQNVKAFDLLISCPSDVSEYIDLIEKEVSRFNSNFGRSHDIVIRTVHWSKNAYSEFGARPQELLNKQIVDSSDMVLGVFWTRFGTPTENYGSGTEEEIERTLNEGKQLFLYFLEKPISPSKIDYDQYSKIRNFMERYKNRGIFFTVSDEKKLAEKFKDNLELYFDSTIRGAEIRKGGKREILWVDDRPENNVYERNILEQYGLDFKLALSTEQALQDMKHNRFSMIISDMGRKEGSREGYVLLEKVRKIDQEIPFIIYAGSNKEEHIREAMIRGAQGCTNRPGELIDLVIKNLLKT